MSARTALYPGKTGRMFRKLRAKSEFGVALAFLLHASPSLIPSIKKMYALQWSGFINDVARGASAYEKATEVLARFIRDIFDILSDEQRARVFQAITSNDFDTPPNILRICAEITYYLYLAELDAQVQPKTYATWSQVIAQLFANDRVPTEDVTSYLIAFANKIRDHTQASPSQA